MTVWTPDMDRLLVQMTGAGYSFVDIGKKLGVTRCAAIGRANRIYSKDPYARLMRAWRYADAQDRAKFLETVAPAFGEQP